MSMNTAGRNTMNDAAEPIVVTNDATARTYQATVGGEVEGTLIYEVQGSRVVLTHTIVEPSVREHGVGSALVRAALDDLRRDGKTATVMCPFVTDFITHNPEYADLVDHEHPGVPYRK
jgi:predicted GNAT family acetyltransferase